MRAALNLETCADDLFDFSDEEPTHPDHSTMAELMASLADEDKCIPSPVSERPTKPIRPAVRWREETDG
jgi:hypothetical protein